jgi:uncharacterized membrane protein YkvA (DUF1232 family)
MSVLEYLKKQANHLKGDIYTLYLVARHPRTPWYAKLFIAGVVAYALSPIDLIPDFIPVIGYLDDLILVPLGISIAIKMIPNPILVECRAQAQAMSLKSNKNWKAGIVIVLIWLVLAALMVTVVYKALF